MLLWFIGLSMVGVWAVFRDPSLDYRLVAGASLLPDFGQLLGRGELHAVAVWAGVLVAVMLATTDRRRLRRRLLAVPLGGFAHLVLDATWARSDVFWWPFLGGSPTTRLSSLDRPVALVVAQEAAGLFAIAWFWRQLRAAEAG